MAGTHVVGIDVNRTHLYLMCESDSFNGIGSDRREFWNIAKSFALNQNFPNPFNITTKIQYALPKESEVSIKVYNITGQLVRTLINDKQKPGYYSISWDGKDDSHRRVASGIYFYRMESGEWNRMRKMVVLR